MKNYSNMFKMFLLATALILSLGACASTDTKVRGKTGDESVKQQESVTEKPVQDDAEEDKAKCRV